MSGVLEAICERKRIHVEERRNLFPLEDIKALAALQPAPRGFIKALREKTADGPALITELKKASPSKGLIREDFNPAEIATIYEQSGAACLSVLTDEPYFQGRDEYLKIVRTVSALPVLRKDFMIDPYQIFESRALGADCVLLIMAALRDDLARQLYDFAKDLGMDVLIEVHNEAELDRALALSPEMIGVNNRNLKTLDVDIATSSILAAKIPAEILKIAESGISGHAEIAKLRAEGYAGFLIGESLMRQPDIAGAVRALLQK
ncbi:MAG: indole-3-glycerol phosphate synthase TrpC [Alphaproteobacteria bacterium]|nr:indole-3-glycerol phosphate synthase TrpC [Alphaproteobacteria bacterium]